MPPFGSHNIVSYNDVALCYQELAQEFVNLYYTTYDSNIQNLVYFFKAESLFTFIDEEIIGFNNLYNRLVNHYCVYKISHEITSFSAQPMGNKTLFIQVIGNLRVNDHMYNTPVQPFTETFVLQRDDAAAAYFIHNTIFKIL